MTLQAGQQIIRIHILPNISRGKRNQAMKRGQLIKYSGEILFFKNYAENEAWRLVPDLFLLFKKALYNIKASGPHFSFHIFWWVST